MVFAWYFPFWCLAAQGLDIDIKWIVLKDSRWLAIVKQICPGIQISVLSEVSNSLEGQALVDIIMVNACTPQEFVSIQNHITSRVILFDCMIRGQFDSYVRYEGKQSHWLVGGATDSVFKYTLFCDTASYKPT